jgi:hypothetical protein
LPNTPKTEEIQVKEDRIRACSAVVNARHTKDDFRELDAYLERKQMEKHDNHLTRENYSNNRMTSDERFNFEYSVHIQDYVDTSLHLSDENYSTSPFGMQNEEKSNQSKSLSNQYQQEISTSSISSKNDFVEDHISNYLPIS